MNTRHWNLIQGFALTALLPLFAACSSEGDELLQGEEKQPVQVNITRATMNDGNDWSWQDKDEIKMNITPYGGTTTEYTLTYGSNTWNPSPEIGTITIDRHKIKASIKAETLKFAFRQGQQGLTLQR